MNGNFPQYMFGPSMMISPIVTPADNKTSLATQPVWIPPGKWLEEATGVSMSPPTENPNS